MEIARVALAPDIQRARIAKLRQLIKRTQAELRSAETDEAHLRCVVIARDLAHYYEQLDAATQGESMNAHAQRRNSAARGW